MGKLSKIAANLFEPHSRTEGFLPETAQIYKSNYLLPFLNTLYYFLLVPFKIIIDSDGQFAANTFRIQQLGCAVICLITGLFLVYFSVYPVLTLFNKASSDNSAILLVLQFVSNTASMYIALITWYLLWRRQNVVLQVLLSTRTKSKPSHKNIMVSIITTAYMLFLAIVSVCQVWTEHNSFDSIDFESMSKLALILKICLHLFLAYCGSTVLLSQGFILCTILELTQMREWLPMKIGVFSTAKRVMNSQIEVYRKIAKIIHFVNMKVLGNLLISSCVGAISYLAQTPYILLGTNENSEKIIMPATLTVMIVWIVAAEFNYSVSGLS